MEKNSNSIELFSEIVASAIWMSDFNPLDAISLYSRQLWTNELWINVHHSGRHSPPPARHLQGPS